MSVLVTGAGLVGTSFAREAIKRDEKIVFFDPEPRRSFIDFKCGAGKAELVRGDVRDLLDVQREQPPQDIGAKTKDKSERFLAAISHYRLTIICKLNGEVERTFLNLLNCILQIIAALRRDTEFIALDLSLD